MKLVVDQAMVEATLVVMSEVNGAVGDMVEAEMVVVALEAVEKVAAVLAVAVTAAVAPEREVLGGWMVVVAELMGASLEEQAVQVVLAAQVTEDSAVESREVAQMAEVGQAVVATVEGAEGMGPTAERQGGGAVMLVLHRVVVVGLKEVVRAELGTEAEVH